MDEFAIIARHFAPLAGPGAFGLGDDAALLPARPGHDLIVTTDTLSVDTDFFAGDPADLIARKALRVTLSDLAAKGATPVCYLLNLTLPGTVTEEWLAAFAKGLADDQQTFGVSLLGGDTGEGPLAITITAFGFVQSGCMVRRGGARVGDHVYVTGTIGDSGAGLAVLRGQGAGLSATDRDRLVARYRVPEPPVAFGASRLGAIAHAGADVSDGLIADLGHIARASNVAIVVDGALVPLSAGVRALWGAEALVRAVTAGDDYQIAFTGPPGLGSSDRSGPFTHIGHVEKGAGVRLMLDGKSVPLARAGFRHFQG
jgi:thiamine-monophosphate kinase